MDLFAGLDSWFIGAIRRGLQDCGRTEERHVSAVVAARGVASKR